MHPRTAAAALAALAPLAVATDGLSITSVFRPGDLVPDMPGFTMGGAGGTASINDAGSVLYTATITGDGITSSNDHVLIGGPLNGLSLIGREREPIPTLPGWIYLPGSSNLTGFYQLAVAPDGGVAYQPTIFETGVSSTWLFGTFAGPVATPSPIVWQTGPAPGFDPGYTVNATTKVAFADGGRAAVSGRASGPTTEYVVWASDPVNGTAVALSSNAQAPGFGAGVEPLVIREASLCLNAQGRLTTLAILEGPGITTSDRNVWFEGPLGGMSVLARQGDAVPFIPGATYSTFDENKMRMNAAGDLCFAAQVVGGGTSAVLMRRHAGVLAPVVKVGDPVPDVPGATFTNLYSGHFDMNSHGDVMFGATLTGQPAATDTAFFIADDAGIRMVLREGDPLPGGYTTPHILTTRFFFNDRQQFVTDLNVDGRAAFFATRPNGELLKLARASEIFFTDDGFAGVIGSVVPWRYDANSLAVGSGGPSMFSNEGQLILSMFFTGSTGSGVFIFDVDDPCPADLVEPFGLLDLADVNAFVTGFIGMTAVGDLDGNGLWDLTDVNIFVNSFIGGCP
ncbi:MAG: hypothetical protein H6810_02240 [Phycisphaeraceae bacterium]|nr:MAG: hypothetical protein H6810_02240 [Phycisphaeraceae bacterium]